MLKIGIKAILATIFVHSLFFNINTSLAQTPTNTPPAPGKKAADSVVSLENPLQGDETDVKKIIGRIIKGAMGILGSVALVVFVYGGFLWLTSGGNSEQVKKGTQTMMWAAIGIFIIFGSYAILNTILKGLTG